MPLTDRELQRMESGQSQLTLFDSPRKARRVTVPGVVDTSRDAEDLEARGPTTNAARRDGLRMEGGGEMTGHSKAALVCTSIGWEKFVKVYDSAEAAVRAALSMLVQRDMISVIGERWAVDGELTSNPSEALYWHQDSLGPSEYFHVFPVID